MFISGGSLVSLRRLSCLSVLAGRASWPRVACDVRRVVVASRPLWAAWPNHPPPIGILTQTVYSRSRYVF